MNTASESISSEPFKEPVFTASPSKVEVPAAAGYVHNGQYYIDPRLASWNIAPSFPYNALAEYPVDNFLYSPIHQDQCTTGQNPLTPAMLAATCRLQSMTQQHPQYLMNLIAASTPQHTQMFAAAAAPAQPSPDWSYLTGKINYNQPAAQFVDSKQLMESMQALSLSRQPPTDDRGQFMFVNKDYNQAAVLGAPSWLYPPQWTTRPTQPRLDTRWPRPTLSVNNLIKGSKDLRPSLHVRQLSPSFNGATKPESSVLQKLKRQNNFNPADFDLTLKGARFFIIKSYSEDDVHRSIKYGIWCSTQSGNKRLNDAYREREGKGAVYLFFSVNESSHFCGIAEMMSPVDYDVKSGVWVQDKWQGKMDVRWLYIKDVPNSQLRHIHLENNGNRPVTFSRDAQEVPFEKGRQVFQIIHNYKHESSLLDDFDHYEQRQREQLRHRRSQQRLFSSQSKQQQRRPAPPQCEYVQESHPQPPSLGERTR